MMVYTYLVTVWQNLDDRSPNGTLVEFRYAIFADSDLDRMALLEMHLNFANLSQLKKAVLVHARAITAHELRLLSEHKKGACWESRYLWAREVIDPMIPNRGTSGFLPPYTSGQLP